MDKDKKIRKFYKDKHRMPTYSEIMDLMGFRSKNAAYRLVKRMIGEGSISQDDSKRLIPGPSFQSVKVLGTVEAGFPSAAEEELVDTMSIDDYLIENRDATYLLKVKGDSMIDAGIHEGDMVLVERGAPAKDGDIVIAEVDGGWTMKYLRRMGGKYFLEAGNSKYKPIMPRSELTITAVVRAVIRKY